MFTSHSPTTGLQGAVPPQLERVYLALADDRLQGAVPPQLDRIYLALADDRLQGAASPQLERPTPEARVRMVNE